MLARLRRARRPPPGVRPSQRGALRLVHDELERARHVRVRLGDDVVGADGADVRHGEHGLVEVLGSLLLDGVRHVGRGDGAEDLALLAHGLLDGELAQSGKRGGERLGRRKVGSLGVLLGLLLGLEVRQHRGRREGRHALRQEVVAEVPVADLGQRALLPQVGHVLQQHNLLLLLHLAERQHLQRLRDRPPDGGDARGGDACPACSVALAQLGGHSGTGHESHVCRKPPPM
mmetsp:Transcript_18160/g.61764  ORF Transcript_18160/g.61764 Transcript_18160/m.61764 type:complete len:231 (-) Transcript_18160:130-822(-)